MASYTLSPATDAWQTLPAPTKDAWLLAESYPVHVSTDASPSAATAGLIPPGVPYPVSAGVAVKVVAASGWPVRLRMWDKT